MSDRQFCLIEAYVTHEFTPAVVGLELKHSLEVLQKTLIVDPKKRKLPSLTGYS